jgi:hypothetical protein
MNGKRRFRSKMRMRNRETPDDFICLSQAMKEIAGSSRIRFVIVDEAENEIPIEISEDGYNIAGVDRSDHDARVFISKHRTDFEGFFMEAAGKQGIRGDVMEKIYLAKLADISGKNNTPAKVSFPDSSGEVILMVSRENDEASFRLGGKKISKSEAEAFVRSRYTDFLIGYKAAAKGTEEEYQQKDDRAEKRRAAKRAAAGIESEFEDGKLRMNINKILGQEKQKEETKRNMKAPDKMPLSEDFFKKKRHGYIPD